MTKTATRPPALAELLAAPVTVAEPDVSGALVVFPLIAAAAPTLRYRAFAQAREQGAQVRELPSGAEVGALMAVNPLDVPVLLYEGEELLGAQQNRSLDISVLVPAGASLRVPVSCVEAGRWDCGRHRDPFAPAPQAAHPSLRKLKNEHVRTRLAAAESPAASQEAVWASVADASTRHGVSSLTDALHDVFEMRRDAIEALHGDMAPRGGQVGMLTAVGGRFVVLDYVSDVEAFAALHDPLVAGYALDALDVPVTEPPSLDDARDFVELLLAQATTSFAAVGLGTGIRLDFGGLAGTGLATDGELVTMTAFAA